MKTIRERVLEQVYLQEEVQRVSSITIVNCGSCGSVVLHKMKVDKQEDIVCPYCSFESDPCDFPDFLYRGMESSEVFDESKTISSYIDADDVIRIAMSLGMNPDIDVIEQVLRDYDSEANNDPTATWELIVENLLYNHADDVIDHWNCIECGTKQGRHDQYFDEVCEVCHSDMENIKKKDEIESLLIDIFDRIGIEVPSNYEDIVQFVFEDVCETADPVNWNNDDVAIGFRRWIELK